jgi:catechol 2,3-dioxygenase
MSEPYTLPAQADIGHVHLKVSDLERSIAFYRDVMGFEITARYGKQAAFLSAGGYHHHLGLNTWESEGGSPPPRRATGLFHFAIRYPDRKALAIALKRLIEAGVPVQGVADHAVSHSIYLADPDGNGIELTIDVPREQWKYEADGSLRMVTEPLDVQALLAEAGPA